MGEVITMDLERVKKLIEENEDRVLRPYVCTSGKLTIGVGRNLTDVGISWDEADNLFTADVNKAYFSLCKILGKEEFLALPETAQVVLMDMCFNLGETRLKGFVKMLDAVKEWDWTKMINEMIDSTWCKQVPTRASKLILMVTKLNERTE